MKLWNDILTNLIIVLDSEYVTTLNQKGVVHIFALVILVLGLVAGLYLVQHPQIFKPRAYEQNKASLEITQCKQGLNSFAVESPCGEDIFEGVSFQCHDRSEFVSGNVGIGTTVTVTVGIGTFGNVGIGTSGNVGVGTSINIGIVTSGNVGIGTTVLNSGGCRTSPEWSGMAKSVCQNRSNCPIPSASPTPQSLSCSGVTVEGAIQTRSGTETIYIMDSGAKAKISAQVTPAEAKVNWKIATASKNLPSSGSFEIPDLNNTSVVNYTAPNNPVSTLEGVQVRGDLSEYPDPLVSCPVINFAIKPAVQPTPTSNPTPKPSYITYECRDGRFVPVDRSTCQVPNYCVNVEVGKPIAQCFIDDCASANPTGRCK